MNAKRFVWVAVFLSIGLAASASRTKPVPPKVTDWVQANAVPISTVEPGQGFEDLAPFKAMVGDAHVVGLGEATHGTHEFFLLKHRLFEFMVNDMGFDTFAIEDSFAEAQAIDDFVLHGTGDPALALRSMGYWVWNTQEFLDLVLWMREWNADPGHLRKVRFFGVDMYKWARSTASVRHYLALVDPAYAAEIEPVLTRFSNDADRNRYNGRRRSEKAADAAALAQLLAHFDAHHADWAAASGEEAWALSRQHARVVGQCQAYWATPNEKVMENLRDESMGENALWLKNFVGPQSRVVLWAHNGHVTGQDRSWGMTPMGVFLKGALGSDYVSVGLHFDRGSFTSKTFQNGSLTPPMVFTVGSSQEGTLNWALASASPEVFVLDLRPVPPYPKTNLKWLWRYEPERWYDAVFFPAVEAAGAYAHWTIPKASYDLVFFIRDTTASTPLP